MKKNILFIFLISTFSQVCLAQGDFLSGQSMAVVSAEQPLLPNMSAVSNMHRKFLLGESSQIASDGIKVCSQQLHALVNRIPKDRTELYPIEKLTSKGSVVEFSSMQLIEELFRSLEPKFSKISKKLSDLPAGDDQISKQRARAIVAKTEKKLLEVQSDIEIFLALNNGKDVEIGKPESVSLHKLFSYALRNANTLPKEQRERLRGYCECYNSIVDLCKKHSENGKCEFPGIKQLIRYFAQRKPIEIPEPVQEDANNKQISWLPSYWALKAYALPQQVHTQTVIAPGGPKRILSALAAHRAGDGCVLGNILSPKDKPAERVGLFRRMVNGIKNITFNTPKRFARWIITKTFFKSGTFNSQPWEKSNVGRYCDDLESQLTGKSKQKNEPPKGFLRRMFEYIRLC